MSEVLVEEDRRGRDRDLAERVLVLAPTGQDAGIIERILQERGVEVLIVENLQTLADELEAGAGAALIATEGLETSEHANVLRATLERQEAWSEFPILLFGGHSENAASTWATDLLGSRSQLVLLERPLGVSAFVTATDAALRSRRRQYEVKRLLDQLALSAVELARIHEAATRAKDDFLATLGHELRSPMTAIRGWIQMLKSGHLAPDDAAMALSMIESSTAVQSRIIEDLMDVSKIIAGKVMIEPKLTSLAGIVQNIVTTFRTGAEERGIQLTLSLPDESLMSMVDEVRIQQVGWNLISNAIKFTPEGGSVHVSLEREGDRALIRVRDTGEGISSELLPHVFERYRQADGATKRQSAGLGLGLAIVRHLVESHGGRITAASEGLGKGAEFVVSLPLSTQ